MCGSPGKRIILSMLSSRPHDRHRLLQPPFRLRDYRRPRILEAAVAASFSGWTPHAHMLVTVPAAPVEFLFELQDIVKGQSDAISSRIVEFHSRILNRGRCSVGPTLWSSFPPTHLFSNHHPRGLRGKLRIPEASFRNWI